MYFLLRLFFFFFVFFNFFFFFFIINFNFTKIILKINQILSTEQIRNQLWEVGAESSSNVVAAQMRLLRRKLANSGCENPIETLHGMGYRLNLTNESK